MFLVRALTSIVIAWPLFSGVEVAQEADRIVISIDGGPPTSFFYGAGVTKPFLYPLRTAGGTVVSRGWPMDPRPGERHDHIHHRGVWFAHSSVNGIDFWNSDITYHKSEMGRIAVTKVDRLVSGAQKGMADVELAWYQPNGKEIVHETRSMVFYAGNPRIIDFDITLTAREAVTFGDDKDGVFGLRLAAPLEAPAKDAPAEPLRTGVMTGSNGCRQEPECWGKRADWIDVSGQIDGAAVGVSIFDHPGNPRHPTSWHVRGYGLMAANIFGLKAFSGNAAENGALALKTGGTLHFRYRLILHSGDAQKAGIPALYKRFSKGE